MPDSNSPTNKPSQGLSPTTKSTTTANTLARNKTVSVGGGLHARLRNPVAQQNDALTRPNRIALLLDVSGSMGGRKIQSLRDACASFINACSFADTALALEPFGEGWPPPNRVDLTCFQPMLLTTVMSLNATGGTPMAEALAYALNAISMTRAVLVSDGQPDHEQAAYDEALHYREAGIPVDCVHIGDSSDGEHCLRRIAEMTGGMFIKFTDINSFAQNFKYLTPAYYAMLTSGRVDAATLGAKELNK